MGDDQRQIEPIAMARCCAFCPPGAPMYAAQCLLRRGHPGEHLFVSKEEAERAWRAATEAAQRTLSIPDDPEDPQFWPAIKAVLEQCIREKENELLALKDQLQRAKESQPC